MARMTLNKSGSFVNFLSPEKANIKSLKVHFSPKQEGSGDPSPENVREIVGWNGVTVHHCGKNLLDINNLVYRSSSYSYINVENGIATGTASSFYWGFSREGSIPISNPLDKQLSVTLTAYTDANAESADSNGIYIRFYYTDGSYSTAPIFKNNDIIKTTKTGTSIAGKIIDRICISYGTLGENIWHISDFHIEVNQTPVSYEPYNGTDYNVTFPSTVYGGYVDLITGELWSNMLYLNMGNMKWAKSGNKFISYGSQLSAQPKTYPRYYMPINWFCSKYKIGTVNSEPQGDKTMCCTINATTILLKDNSFETVEELLTNLDGIQFVYELATPQLITTITPQNLQTLINTNNFWSNADYIDIEYELAESRDIQSIRKRIMLDNQPHKDAASGQLVNFSTDLVSPLKGCKVNFLPKQSGSGDPSPTNIRPISGWDGVNVTRCGKNLFSGTERDTLYPVHIPVGTKVSASVKGQNSGVRYYDKDRVRIDYWTLSYTPNFDSSRRYNTFTIINRDCEYFEFYGGTSPTDMQVEIIPQTSSLPTPYEPYTASTFPVTFPVTGKNLFDLKWLLTSAGSLTDGVLADKAINFLTAFGTAAGGMPNTDYESQIAVSITAKNGQEYSATGRGFTIKVVYDDETEGTLVYFSNTVTDFTTATGVSTAGKKVVKLYLDYGSGGSNVWHIKDLMIVKGSTAQAYEPYTTTVYGGYVDLVSGEVWKEWHKISFDENTAMRSYTSDWRNAGLSCNASYRLSTVGAPNAADYVPYSTDGFCDKLPYAENNYLHSNIIGAVNSTFSVTLEGTRTQEQYLAWVAENSPITMCYRLATPTLITTLTPQQIKTLRGVNNIYSDTNDITEVTYYKHSDDTHQNVAADAIISNDNFVIITDDKYVIGNNQDYITY